MYVGCRMGAMALAMMATLAAASPPRSLVVVGAPGDPRVDQQIALLQRDAALLQARDVLIRTLTPAAAQHERPDLGVTAQARFEVLLVGRDGGVKLRRATLVDPAEIAALIDTMPMRRAKMGR
jgi:hypothetical protein